MSILHRLACCLGAIGFAALAGCEGRPALVPNSDPTLNRTSTQFAADAAKRFPYPASLPHVGTADGRAMVDVMLTRLQILNSSDEDWNDIEIWVNQSYVVHIRSIPKGKQTVETVGFEMLYNVSGDYFSTSGGKNPVNLVEMRRNGKIYQLPIVLAD
jgi:hypothetical protein